MVHVGMKEQEYRGGEAIFSLPLLLPCHVSFNLTPTSQNTFFSLSKPPLLVLTRNTPVLQTKTLVVSGTQAPIKFTDEGSCFVSSQQVILKKV